MQHTHQPEAGKREQGPASGYVGRIADVLTRRSGAAKRKHVRHRSSCIGILTPTNSSTVIDGIVTEVSRSGLRFRPAKKYILERRGVEIVCEFAGFQLAGKIVATRADGYGIALHNVIEKARFDSFVSSYQDTDLLWSGPKPQSTPDQPTSRAVQASNLF